MFSWVSRRSKGVSAKTREGAESSRRMPRRFHFPIIMTIMPSRRPAVPRAIKSPSIRKTPIIIRVNATRRKRMPRGVRVTGGV